MTPQLADHLFVLILAVLVPLRARYNLRRLMGAAPEAVPRVRRNAYRMIVLFQWALTAILVVVWRMAGRSWGALGLVPRLGGGAIGVAIGTAIVIVILVVQRRPPPGDPVWERLRGRMRRLERLMPRTRTELRWFEAVSFTAGVCEEILYRGFLIAYIGHWVGVVPAAFLAAAIFGIAHLYQGPAGILRTGALGGFLASVYLLTGSLYLPMVLHVMADAYSGRLMFEAYRNQAAAAAASGNQA